MVFLNIKFVLPFDLPIGNSFLAMTYILFNILTVSMQKNDKTTKNVCIADNFLPFTSAGG